MTDTVILYLWEQFIVSDYCIKYSAASVMVSFLRNIYNIVFLENNTEIKRAGQSETYRQNRALLLDSFTYCTFGFGR